MSCDCVVSRTRCPTACDDLSPAQVVAKGRLALVVPAAYAVCEAKRRTAAQDSEAEIIVDLGHGYGGFARPPLGRPRDDCADLVPCVRGRCRSRCPPIPEDPSKPVLYGIQDRDSAYNASSQLRESRAAQWMSPTME